jgi:hypothetical protein
MGGPEMKLTSKTTEYEFEPKEIAMLIADNLRAPVEKIQVNFVIQEVGGDPLDRYPGTPTVTKVRVTVDNF